LCLSGYLIFVQRPGTPGLNSYQEFKFYIQKMNRNKSRFPLRRKSKQPSVAAIVKSVLAAESEIKCGVIVNASTAAATAGAVVGLTQPIIEGTNVNQRVGRQITLKRASCIFNATLPTLGVTATLRFILFFDKMNTGAVPAVTDVLDAAATQSAYAIITHLEKRFTILYDQVYSMAVGGADQQLSKRMDFKLNTKVTYGSSTNVTAANAKNSLFGLVITDNGTNGPTYAYTIALYFHDD